MKISKNIIFQFDVLDEIHYNSTINITIDPHKGNKNTVKVWSGENVIHSFQISSIIGPSILYCYHDFTRGSDNNWYYTDGFTTLLYLKVLALTDQIKNNVQQLSHIESQISSLERLTLIQLMIPQDLYYINDSTGEVASTWTNRYRHIVSGRELPVPSGGGPRLPGSLVDSFNEAKRDFDTEHRSMWVISNESTLECNASALKLYLSNFMSCYKATLRLMSSAAMEDNLSVSVLEGEFRNMFVPSTRYNKLSKSLGYRYDGTITNMGITIDSIGELGSYVFSDVSYENIDVFFNIRSNNIQRNGSDVTISSIFTIMPSSGTITTNKGKIVIDGYTILDSLIPASVTIKAECVLEMIKLLLVILSADNKTQYDLSSNRIVAKVNRRMIRQIDRRIFFD